MSSVSGALIFPLEYALSLGFDTCMYDRPRRCCAWAVWVMGIGFWASAFGVFGKGLGSAFGLAGRGLGSAFGVGRC
eukprot:699210-Amorphochlora_amoeboformis.AAC.1